MQQVRALTFSWQVNPLTVTGMLERVAVPRGEWLLQTAAGSTLGRLVRHLPAYRPADASASMEAGQQR